MTITEYVRLLDLITAHPGASLEELREEADDHLEKLRDALDVGDGDIIEIDSKDAELESTE
ncbi:hypothetical protein DJ83_12655 [Halorubrum ezzemoulense]|uniref:Uncharacterized protein n=2 Tax=Halorubrum ezzemoulense TaxID=337243 RepID=A0A256ISQ3_HALEZ|nr:hypothetical protein DJ83_12655 [Halorubrum ezzemoulense]